MANGMAAASPEHRLSIAEALKREAGVTGHIISHDDFSGLAYIGTGRIRSPEGRSLRQLYIVAHECGHIFLHNAGAGFLLPAHVKELEAECYAHQAFRRHGIEVPDHITRWGRAYVASWIERDRRLGAPIDPRAVAYAAGSRSPFDPLRRLPDAWRDAPAAAGAREPDPLPRLEPALEGPAQPAGPAPDAAWRRAAGTCAHLGEMWRETAEIATWASFQALLAAATALVALQLGPPAGWLSDAALAQAGEVTSGELCLSLAAGLVWANLALTWRTLTRDP